MYVDTQTTLSPRKADLLQGIQETGSISAVARRIGMSYKRAGLLTDTLNLYFREPLVISAVGGKSGGSASLTPLGIEVLARYRHMQSATERPIGDDVGCLSELIAAQG